jgi:cytoskeletal protein RodZ
VYRRRRLAVLLAVLIVVGGIVALVLWQPWRPLIEALTAETPPASTSAPVIPSTSSSSAAPDPSSSESAAPDASGESSPDASPDPSATIALCSSGVVTVTAVMDQGSYGSGEKPQLSISVVNEGDEACVMNVGTSTQSFTIESGSDTWWRSTDCQSESSDHIVQLEPGKSVSSVTPLTWDRTRSSVDTCDRDRPAARPGYYNLVVAIGGIDSEPRQFRLR